MIKGINRHMIEIADTGSPYFERALLVVQPQFDTVDETALHAAAKNLLEQADHCGHVKNVRRRFVWTRLALMALSAVIGATVTLLLQFCI